MTMRSSHGPKRPDDDYPDLDTETIYFQKDKAPGWSDSMADKAQAGIGEKRISSPAPSEDSYAEDGESSNEHPNPKQS